MLCTECGCEMNRVLKTYRKVNGSGEDVIERVRQCQGCGFPWVTEEKVRENGVNKGGDAMI